MINNKYINAGADGSRRKRQAPMPPSNIPKPPPLPPGFKKYIIILVQYLIIINL